MQNYYVLIPFIAVSHLLRFHNFIVHLSKISKPNQLLLMLLLSFLMLIYKLYASPQELVFISLVCFRIQLRDLSLMQSYFTILSFII